MSAEFTEILQLIMSSELEQARVLIGSMDDHDLGLLDEVLFEARRLVQQEQEHRS